MVKNTPVPKESVYRGYLLIPVGYEQYKRFIIATLDRKFVSAMGEYKSKGEAKKVIRNLSQS